MFSISEEELEAASDTSLPGYDQTSVMTDVAKPHTLELGTKWAALHAALGNHGATHPLGFLGGGGAAFAALDDGAQSNGRYFTPALVDQIRWAVDRMADMYLRPDLRADFERLRTFLHEAGDQNRGIVVHQFG